MPPSRNDDARLAYSATLLAFWRVWGPLGRRCGVSSPWQSPGFRLLFGLFVSVICLFLCFWFLLSGLSPPPCLCTAPCILKLLVILPIPLSPFLCPFPFPLHPKFADLRRET